MSAGCAARPGAGIGKGYRYFRSLNAGERRTAIVGASVALGAEDTSARVERPFSDPVRTTGAQL